MSAAQRFAEALSSGDLAALGGTLAPGVRLRSPISNGARLQGPERIVELYRDVLDAVDDVQMVQIASHGDIRVLQATGWASGTLVEEIVVAKIGADGLITELSLYVRDLPALAALAAALGPRVAPSWWRSVLIRIVTVPVALLLRVGDRAITRLARVR